MVHYQYYLVVGAILFVLGVIGFVTRRNLFIMFLCTELMFSGVILTLAGFNRYWLLCGKTNLDGQVFSLYLMVVAAAEAALAMALVVKLQRWRKTVDSGEFTELNG